MTRFALLGWATILGLVVALAGCTAAEESDIPSEAGTDCPSETGGTGDTSVGPAADRTACPTLAPEG